MPADQACTGPLPVHVALIMDGNGRWAAASGLDRHAGHVAGERAVTETVLAAADLGVRWLSLYAFSSENAARPEAEVRFILSLIEGYIRAITPVLHQRNIRMRFIGRQAPPVPPSLIAAMAGARAATSGNTGMTMTTAVYYGGRAEITDAVKRLIDAGVTSSEVTEELIGQYLYDPEMPDPDLIIRTAGDLRMSNFFAWQGIYSELMFPGYYWPDLTAEKLAEAIRAYQARRRRFGRLLSPAHADPGSLRCRPAQRRTSGPATSSAWHPSAPSCPAASIPAPANSRTGSASG